MVRPPIQFSLFLDFPSKVVVFPIGLKNELKKDRRLAVSCDQIMSASSGSSLSLSLKPTRFPVLLLVALVLFVLPSTIELERKSHNFLSYRSKRNKVDAFRKAAAEATGLGSDDTDVSADEEEAEPSWEMQGEALGGGSTPARHSSSRRHGAPRTRQTTAAGAAAAAATAAAQRSAQRQHARPAAAAAASSAKSPKAEEAALGLATATKLHNLATATLRADGRCLGTLCEADENQEKETVDVSHLELGSPKVRTIPEYGETAGENCHGRGAGADPNDPRRRQCRCAVMYDGDTCEISRELLSMPALENFQGAFDGSFLMAQSTLKDGDNIAVSRNPAAEDASKAAPAKIARVTPALRLTLPSDDVWRTRFFRKCAIVGSSGILLTHELGAEIDSHDMVFRFNSAKTKGFEKFVGTKTTHRITNSRNFGFRENLNEVVFAHMRNPTSLTRMLSKRRRHPTLRFWGIHPAWHRYVDTSFRFLSTSGLFGILLSLHRCLEPPNLYGFQVHQRHGVAYHYYDDGQPASESRDGEEWQVVKALAEAGVVTFRESCVLECHESDAACKSCRASSS